MQILLNPFVSPELCSKNLRQFRCGVNGLQGQEDQCTVEYDPGGEFRIIGIEHELLVSDQGVSQEYGYDQHGGDHDGYKSVASRDRACAIVTFLGWWV